MVRCYYPAFPCGSGSFSLDDGRIVPLPLPRHVVRDTIFNTQIAFPLSLKASKTFYNDSLSVDNLFTRDPA